MSKKIIKFNPAILRKKSIREYSGYSQSFAFKINKPKIKDGYINVPKEVGLGVKLDWDLVKKYS